MKPKLTIGVPVFNEAAYIEETLRSILATVGPEVPILVSDNHSTDATCEIVSRLAMSQPSIRLIRNPDESAASNFRNCLLNAETDYFCWIAGHDLMSGPFWAEAIGLLDESPDILWVYGSCALIDADGDPYDAEQAADSDVDTEGLSDAEILKKLVRVSSGMFIHGVFRRERMVACPLAGGWASDRCMIAYACFRGGVRWLRSQAIIRRIQRSADGGETLEQRNERYRKWGFLEYEESGLDPDRYMRLKLLRIYLGERFGRVSVRELREAIKTLFRKGDWKRDLQVLWQLRKLRSVETFFPKSSSAA